LHSLVRRRRRIENSPSAFSQMSKAFFEHPILYSPYEYPPRHWELDESGRRQSVRSEGNRRYHRMLTARAASGATAASEIADRKIIRIFAQRVNTGKSIGENAVLVLEARER